MDMADTYTIDAKIDGLKERSRVALGSPPDDEEEE